jgi:sarcosine oxidase
VAFDVTVVGLGVMGSAVAWQLARRGLRVLGLEQFAPAHDRGSSHGLTRVIRQAYFEDPAYVPLVLRAYELWGELERETGRKLLMKMPALMIGQPESPVVRGSLQSAQTHGLKHRFLSTSDLRTRFPFMNFLDNEVALEEFDAGILFAEDAVLAFQESAERHGAELRFNTVASVDAAATSTVVLSAGSWVQKIVPALPLKVERQVVFWFEPKSPAPVPLFVWERGESVFYSLPDAGGHGVKTAFHHGGEITSADSVSREVTFSEMDQMRGMLEATVPTLNGTLMKTTTCLYTNTPDGHFAIGFLPGDPGTLVVSPCSGHGFKFAPVIGEIAADLLIDLLIDGRTSHPIDLFRLDRFL